MKWRAAAVALCVLAACGGDGKPSSQATAKRTTTTGAAPVAPTAAPTTTTSPPTPLPPGVIPRPAWLGTRVLPEQANGLAKAQPTPPELMDRRLVTTDKLRPPPTDAFASTIDAVPADVVARSTWVPACPVALDDLRYVTVSFRGFDGRAHTGELLVHRSAANGIVSVFRKLYDARFPIEQMTIVTQADLDAPPTGDGNGTGAFVCRPVVGTKQSWSQHAYGLAIDVNPFHNPYVKGAQVVPELASAYMNRSRGLPGMIEPGSPVVRAFASIAWSWGGRWSSSKDYMHFSKSGG